MKVSHGLPAVALAASLVAAGCGDVNGALARLAAARQAAADLQLAFTRAVDASNRAVMAETDAESVRDAQDAIAARQAAHRDIDALRPLLDQLGYTDEKRMLDQFAGRFAAYETLDGQILDLAVENTNLKAQRLSFDAGEAAAGAFRDAVQALTAAQTRDAWRVRATAATALAAIREIQVLQGPHIAAAEDASMTRFETSMQAEETMARGALGDLAPLVDAASRPKLTAAANALDRFVSVNAQIITLSRRNTNVRSLALSLNQKQQLIPPCDQSLRELRDALAHRGYPKGRWE